MARTKLPIHVRGETLGFDTPKPWSLNVLYLLFNAPRLYQPLVDAWDARVPGTKRNLSRLVELGMVEYQEPIIVDTLTGEPATTTTKPAKRYRITAAGTRLLEEIDADSGVLQDFTPKTSPANRLGVHRLLQATATDASGGISARAAIERSGLAARTGRWWLARLVEENYVRELDELLADVREVVPAHWRPNRLLARHLIDICEERTLPGAGEVLVKDLRLRRSRYLDDIDPARLGVDGATDYDHDVGAQRVLARFVASERFITTGLFAIEPRLTAYVDSAARPWRFDPEGDRSVFYQPDAWFREYDRNGVVRGILEYERYQTRRDGWAHIERCVGYVGTNLPVFEPVIVRFVVDSVGRARSYTELIEAYADWLIKNPNHRPRHNITLAVNDTARLAEEGDPLALDGWWRITLPTFEEGDGSESALVLHSPKHSPYESYFGG